MTVVDYPDYATPQAHATAISTTGVPLLTGSASLFNNSGVQPPGAAHFSGQAVVGQIGYEVFITLTCPAGTAVPAAAIQLNWSDTVSGHKTWEDEWILAASSVGTATYYGNGPTKGNQLQWQITDLDAANNITYTVVILQNSRVYARDDWRCTVMGTIPNFGNATHTQQAGLLCSASANVAANSQQDFYFPLYKGLVSWTFITAGQAAKFSIEAPFDPNIGANNLFLQLAVAANSTANITSALPAEQCLVILANTGGVAQVLTAIGIIAEQQS